MTTAANLQVGMGFGSSYADVHDKLVCTNTTTSFATTPYKSAHAPASFEVVVRVKVGANGNCIASRANVWLLELSGDLTQVFFVWYFTGSSQSVVFDNPWQVGETGWLKVTYSAGTVTMYTSKYGNVWQLEGSGTAAHTLIANTNPICLGGIFATSTTVTSPFTGEISYFTLKNSATGAVVASADLDRVWDWTTPQTTWTSDSADTWTVHPGAHLASDYIDVTAYVRDEGLTVNPSHRSPEEDTFDAGSAAWTLSNVDRRFDPTNAAGPYFGKLLPRTPVRVRALYGGTINGLFAGLVTGGFNQAYNTGNTDSTVAISCTDVGGVIYGEAPPDKGSPVYDGLLGTVGSVQHDWRFTDPTALSDNVAGGYDLAWLGGAATASDTTSNVTTYPTVAMGTVYGRANQYDGLSTFTFSTFFSCSEPDGGIYLYVLKPTDTDPSPLTNARFSVWIDGTGSLRATATTITNTYSVLTSGVNLLDGAMHHIAVSVTSSSILIFIDGETVSVSASGSMASVVGWQTPVNATIIGYSASGDDFHMDATAIFDPPVFDVGLLVPFGTIANGGFVISSAAYRANFLAEASGIQADRIDLGTGPDLVNWPTKALSPLAEFQILAEESTSFVYIDGNGSVVIPDQFWFAYDTASNTVQFTLSDDGNDVRYLADGFTLTYDDALIQNQITTQAIQQDGDATRVAQYATDDASVMAYGPKPGGNTSLTLHSDAVVANVGQRRLYFRKDATPRFDSVQIYCERNPSFLYPLLLGVDIGNLVQVERTPQKHGSQIVELAHVVGIQHDITSTTWITTLTLDSTFTNKHFARFGSSKFGGPDVFA